jgi:hypothetical protein
MSAYNQKKKEGKRGTWRGMKILRQLSGNWTKIQCDRMSNVTPIPDSDRTQQRNLLSCRMAWHDPSHPLSRSNFGCFCLHFRFDVRHCMHAYGTHNAHTQWEMHRSVMRTGDLLAMTPAGVQATAAAVAVAAARAERNNIRGFWT